MTTYWEARSNPRSAGVSDTYLDDILAVAYYQAARNEVIERIRARDESFLAYLGSVFTVLSGGAALYGALISSHAMAPIDALKIASYAMAFVPIMSFAFSYLVSQHHALIGALEAYLATEFDDAARDKGATFVQWDRSSHVAAMKEMSIFSRFVAHVSVYCGIGAISIAGFAVTQVWIAAPTIIGTLYSSRISKVEALAMELTHRSPIAIIAAAVGTAFVFLSIYNVVRASYMRRRSRRALNMHMSS